MATRRSAVAVPNVKKTVGDYITEFLQQLGNQFCADCLAKNPQWIAFPHGVIVCDNCAGAHRSLGSHVSQVKSVVYDKWSMQMYRELEKCGGNTAINTTLSKYCEHYQQPNPQTSADDREKFIKNKYELKLYTQPQKTNEKAESAKRLAHYFLIVTKHNMILPQIPKPNPNDGNNGKSQPHQPKRFVMPESIFAVEFTKCVSYRYPETDYESVPLPGRVFDFIFPESLCVSDQMNVPQKRAFVLTDAEGAKQYGVCLVFWERISPMDILNMCETLNTFRKQCDHNEITTMPGAVYAPKAICLLSHWPFFAQFSTFLQTIYRVTKTPSSPIPVERYLMNFMHEVPVPPMGKTAVQFVVGDVSITLRRNPPNALPFLHVNGLNLFKCLSVGNVLTLFNALLQEQKTVLISHHLHLLLEAAECISSLLFPFAIQGVYMPLLPSKLLDFLHSPVPFLAGVNPSWIKGQHYDDVVFVYLDDDTILTTSSTQLEALPQRPKKKLESKLEELLPWLNKNDKSPNKHKTKLYKTSMGIGGGNLGATYEDEEKYNMGGMTQHINHSLDLLPISHFLTSGSTIQSNDANKEQNSEGMTRPHEIIFRDIQKAFLKFFTSILEQHNVKYTDKQRKNDPSIRRQEYIYFKLNKVNNLVEFQREKFLEEGIDKNFRPFMEILTQTQLFMAFCQEREEMIESRSKDIPYEIRYFDEEIIAKKNRSTLRTKKKVTSFLDDRSMNLKSVFVANQPNLNDLDLREYSYSSFPNGLKKERFGIIRKVTAPWDNRMNNVSKLRRTKSLRTRGGFGHVKNEQTFGALQQLMAMQHTAHINKAQSWDNFTVQTLIAQRYIRMIIERNKFFKLRENIVSIQRNIRLYNETRAAFKRFNTLKRDAVTLQSVFQTYFMVQSRRHKIYYQSTTTLQAVFRGYLHNKQFKKLYTNSINLQCAFRTYLLCKESRQKLSAILLCQTYISTANARSKHIGTISSVSRCQAVLRGTLLRRQQGKVLNTQLTKIRREILELWQKTYSAFMYRAKFWIVYERASYLNLAIHNEELVRLRNLLHRLNTSPNAKTEAKLRFETEKQELRRLLKEELQQNIRESLYTSWGINIKSKSKKDKLLSELFKNELNTKQSATVLLTICSSHSSSILDVTSQVELRKADRIRDNLLLTVFSSLSSMHSLNNNLQRQQKINRKLNVNMKTLNDELSHKQEIINKARRESLMNKRDSYYNHHTHNSLYNYPGFNRPKSFNKKVPSSLKLANHGSVGSGGRRFSDINISMSMHRRMAITLNFEEEKKNNEPDGGEVDEDEDEDEEFEDDVDVGAKNGNDISSQLSPLVST